MKILKFGLVILTCFALVGCGLPRSAPRKADILKGSTDNGGQTNIIYVDEDTISAANNTIRTDFPRSLINGGVINTDILRTGDRLSIVIYENVDNGVFGRAGAPSSIPEVEIDQNGQIFIPFAGLIKASGQTIDGLRQKITDLLAQSTPDPQIQVLRTLGAGSSVSIVGPASSAAVPVTSSTRKLTEILAATGTLSSSDAEATKVRVKRNQSVGEVWLSDLYSGIASNIAVRPGDQIFVSEDERQFTLIGELSGQGLINFPKPELSLIEGLTLAGGLNNQSANPKGIFLFREEPAVFARKVLKNNAITEVARIAYVVDITKPNGLFLARDLRLKDGDTILVTEAPYAQWTKLIAAFFTTTDTARNLSTIRNDFR